MANVGNQIGISGGARQFGIVPAGTTAGWTGVSGTSRSGVVVNKSLNLTLDSDVTDSKDGSGTWQGRRSINQKATIKVEVEPIGTAQSDAAAIAKDPPRKNSILTLTGPAGETSKWCLAAGTSYLVTGSSASYSPDGAATLSIDCEVWLDDSGSAVTLATFS